MKKAKAYTAAKIVETKPLRFPISQREQDAIQEFNRSGCVGALNSAGLYMQRNGKVVRKEYSTK